MEAGATARPVSNLDTSARLGPAPIQGALNWSISDDGRRAIAVKNVDRPDAYIIRNFRDVLRRP